MTKPVIFPYETSNTRSPEHNILRVLFTYWLNTGVLDTWMRETEIKPISNTACHVGRAFLMARLEPIRVGFLEWIMTDPLASFMTTDSVRKRIHAFGTKEDVDHLGPCSYEPFDTIAGTRFKVVSDIDRARLPKDIKKSFHTKARRFVIKFAEQYLKWDWEDSNMTGGDEPTEIQRKRDVKDWIEFAIKHDSQWVASENLRQIRNLYRRMSAFENLEDVLHDLLQEASVANVMLS